MSAPTEVVFRADKDKETGVQKGWKVFGPAELILAGQPCTVTKKDGTTTDVVIGRVSKTFDVEGVECVYGYLAGGEE